jgi:hypothetical protein
MRNHLSIEDLCPFAQNGLGRVSVCIALYLRNQEQLWSHTQSIRKGTVRAGLQKKK